MEHAKNGNIILRHITEADMADYVRWTTVEIEWYDWDAPWEDDEDDFVEMKKASIGAEPHFYSNLEIDIVSGRHIGWVITYDMDEERTAVGLNIPLVNDRGKGYGEDALTLFMSRLFEKEETLYTQTWAGNAPMIRLAEKIGFTEIERIKDLREIRGKKYDALTFSIAKNDFFSRHPGLRT